MHATRVRILECFKQHELKPLSTSTLVSALFPAATQALDKIILDNFSSKDQKKHAIEEKAKYHRQLLHHLNILVEEEILSVIAIKGKGQKHFAPILGANEELVIGNKKQKIVLTSKSTPSTPIEGYEEAKILHKFEAATWIDRLNAILLEPIKFASLDDLYLTFTGILSHINDVIALNDFEKIIQSYPIQDTVHLVDRLSKDCADYNKRVCLIIDATNILDDDIIEQFFLLLTKINSQLIMTVFDVTPRELMIHRELFEKLVQFYSKYNLKMNFKNDEVHHAPYMVGKAGPYTLDQKDWQEYVTKHYQKQFGMSISQSTIVVDVNRFLQKHRQAKQFTDMMMNVARSQFIANSLQRRDHEDYFRHIIKQPLYTGPEFFSFSSSVIRLLNYKNLPEDMSFENFCHLLEDVKSQIEKFATNQEVIFMSCGMPIRFKLVLSHAYRKFNDDPSLYENYELLKVNGASDLYARHIRLRLAQEERLKDLFLGGHEVRFLREGTATPQDIISECAIILNTYKFPFFCYKFSLGASNDVSLKKFLGDFT